MSEFFSNFRPFCWRQQNDRFAERSDSFDSGYPLELQPAADVNKVERRLKSEEKKALPKKK